MCHLSCPKKLSSIILTNSNFKYNFFNGCIPRCLNDIVNENCPVDVERDRLSKCIHFGEIIDGSRAGNYAMKTTKNKRGEEEWKVCDYKCKWPFDAGGIR